MMRSMYSGVAGLRVHQTKMDVIGNNIANVNTVGFKRSTVSFQEIYNQTIRGAGSPQGGRGGTNPQQVGLGVNVASITVNHSKGSNQNTGFATDLMINGNGYFVVANDTNAQNRYYTRAGNFDVDKTGFLVAPNGFKVLDENMKPIQINRSEIKSATATTNITLKGNINTKDAEYKTSIDIFDSLGNVQTLTVKFSTIDDTTTPDKIYRKIEVIDSAGNTIYGGAGAERFVQFGSSGKYEQIVESAGGIPPKADPAKVAVDDATTEAMAAISIPGASNITLTMSKDVFKDSAGNVLLTQVSNTSDAKGDKDGNGAGALKEYTISDKGEVIGSFTNGETKVLAKIGLADFDNPAGLLKVGGNMFIDSPNSGTPKLGAPATGSFGELNPGALEMSNVDLSLEFTDMISTQRGFQANSRIITTTDEMLQELVNLKR